MRLGVEVEGDVHLLSVIDRSGDDIFGVPRGVARTSGTHESNDGCPDRASRRAPRGKPTAPGFGNPSAAPSPSSG